MINSTVYRRWAVTYKLSSTGEPYIFYCQATDKEDAITQCKHNENPNIIVLGARET